MKKSLHLQILSYLKEQDKLVNLKTVFEQFLHKEQGLLIQDPVSECRGNGCFHRLSDILFAINQLQQDKQIILAHIDVEIPQCNSNGYNNPIKIGCTDSVDTNGKITGDYQQFLKKHVYSIIHISEDSVNYIRRGGISKELHQANIQTILASITTGVSILTLLIANLLKI